VARTAPRLYRVSGILRGIGTVIVVVVMIYLAAAIYSASQLRGNGDRQTGSSSVTLLANGTALLAYPVNLTNPGYFGIDDLSVSLQVRDPAGSLLAVGGVAAETIPARGDGTIPVQIWIPLGGGAAGLLTNDIQLTYHIWLNASYASLFNLHIGAESNSSWGAPFYHLNASPGAPQGQTNGSVLVPVTVTFQNHAGFSDVGAVSFSVVSPSGTSCGSGTLAVNAPAGSNFAQTANVWMAPGCNPSGGHVVASYTGEGITIALPAEAIP
jgi:hypothetical protein